MLIQISIEKVNKLHLMFLMSDINKYFIPIKKTCNNEIENNIFTKIFIIKY